MTKKTCCTCKELKSISEFGKDKNSKDGYRKRCSSCRKKEHHDYYHNCGGKEKMLTEKLKAPGFSHGDAIIKSISSNILRILLV